MTEDALIDATFDKEGRAYGDQHTKPPIDQPTAPGGITLATYSSYLGRQATLAELRSLTVDAARPIVRWSLRRLGTLYRFDAITFEPLRYQMIDFAYNSGASTAIRWLQRVLRVERSSNMDTDTLAALATQDAWLVNQALVGARLQMIDMWTDADKQRKAWEEGLESRGLLFSLLEVP